jgi:hypothetical protein
MQKRRQEAWARWRCAAVRAAPLHITAHSTEWRWSVSKRVRASHMVATDDTIMPMLSRARRRRRGCGCMWATRETRPHAGSALNITLQSIGPCQEVGMSFHVGSAPSSGRGRNSRNRTAPVAPDKFGAGVGSKVGSRNRAGSGGHRGRCRAERELCAPACVSRSRSQLRNARHVPLRSREGHPVL